MNPTRLLAPGRLLKLLHRRGPLTRATITEELGLARSAVGTALDELTTLGLVRVGDPTRPPAGTVAGRGRPSPVIEIDPAGPTAIAVQITGDRMTAAPVGLDQEIGDLRELRLAETDPETVVRLVAEVIADMTSGTDRPWVGTCVALPGFVREADGYVWSSLHLGWSDVPFAELLARHLPAGPPVTVGRASGLAAVAECLHGAGRGATGVLALNCEHLGVGGGFVSDGTLFTGTGYALEAGHTLIAPGGRPCRCGARGCLEMYADGRALLHAAGFTDARDGRDRVAELLDRAARGEPGPMRAVRSTAKDLAIGMASLINILSPERVLLLGLLAELYRIAGDVVHEDLLKSSIVAGAGQVTVGIGSLRHPVLIGAAERAFTRLLTDPRTALRSR